MEAVSCHFLFTCHRDLGFRVQGSVKALCRRMMTCVVVSASLPVQKSKDGIDLASVGNLSPLDPLRTDDKPELYFDYMVNLLGAKELNSKGEDVRLALKNSNPHT